MLIFYQFEQNQIKASMFDLLNDPDSKFEKLTLSLPEYENCKVNSHEIYYNGEMYDVKSADLKVDHVNLVVLHDKHEKNIIEKIKNYFTSNSKHDSKIPNHLVKLISNNYDLPSTDFNYLLNETYQNIYKFFSESLLYPHFEIATPPPRIT